MDKYIGRQELALLKEVIASQKLWKKEGAFVRKFEEEFGKHLGVKHAIAVNSGTSALEACVAAGGIGAGDEVICTAYSFIASSMVVLRANGVPVFADVDPKTLCLDPGAIAGKITARTKAILVVHIYGQPAEMDRIMQLARKHHLLVIEDCCQAYDSYYRGKKVGTIGDIAAFSLQQGKQITSGEGGIVATNNKDLFRKASMFANIGMIWDWERPEAGSHFALGGNYRMGELQGAVALAQLRKIGRFNGKRRRFARIIESELKNAEGIKLAHVYRGAQPNYYFYPLRYDAEKAGLSHAEFIRRCNKQVEGKKIEIHAGTIRINYLEPIYRDIARLKSCPIGCPKYKKKLEYKRGLCPNLEKAVPDGFITIRMHHGRTAEEISAAAGAIKRVLREAKLERER
ncbi:MAG: DegT/DnrJ/EryC1/StrS family aminotransferase [Kiritimatiellae bacterium]|nr:DegT/DnrJ/EryC1/StrS family aminotransferase [Kiritimatiellia bacterium]